MDRTSFSVGTAMALALAVGGSPASSSLAAAGSAQQSFKHPADIFKTLGKHKKQIWVVGYADSTVEDAILDAQTSFENGADAIVFESSKFEKFDEILKEVRAKFPDKVLGVNFLGDDNSDVKNTFALAKKHGLQIAWTDFSGVDLIKERPEISLHSIEADKAPGVFYVSGIHMKYSTLLDPTKSIEKSALQAMGWVDGIVVTGAATGKATNPDDVRRVRAVVGRYPVGAASGVTPENVREILTHVDFVLVNTGISNMPTNRRIVAVKLKALRKAMDKGTR